MDDLTCPALALPQIKWLNRVGLKWQRDFPAGTGGFIGGKQDLHHDPGVFPCDQRLPVMFHTVDKVFHFLNEAVVPSLLVNGKRPTNG